MMLKIGSTNFFTLMFSAVIAGQTSFLDYIIFPAISTIFGLGSLGMQSQAAGQAKEAGRLGGLRVEAETEEKIRRTTATQAQTIGTTKALAAGSGIQVDFSKPLWEQVSTSTTESVTSIAPGIPGPLQGILGAATTQDVTTIDVTNRYTEGAAGIDLYIQRMQQEFDRELDWIKESGRIRAAEVRAGGTAAESQALAGTLSTGMQLVNQAYEWWGP